MKYLSIIIVLIFLFTFNLSAQTSTSIFTDTGGFFKQYPTHYKNSMEESFNFQNNRLLIYTGIVTVPIAFLLDDAVQKYAYKNGFFSKDISEIGNVYGHRRGYFIVLSCILATDIYKGESKQHIFAKTQLMVESILTGQAIIEVTKRLTGRRRPNGNDTMSFPSGHSGGAFTLATCLQEFYGKKVGIPAYCIAGFIALSRINDNKHYLSDVVVGGLIGTLIGHGFARQYHLEWYVKPELYKSGLNLGVSYSF